MSAIHEARDFLTTHLAGGPQPVKRMKEWAKAKGISDKTLTRARQQLTKEIGLSTDPIDGVQHWHIPNGPSQVDYDQPAQVAQVAQVAQADNTQPTAPKDQVDNPDKVDHTQPAYPAVQPDTQATQHDPIIDDHPTEDVPDTTAVAVATDNNSAATEQLPPCDTVTTATAVATLNNMVQIDDDLIPQIQEWADGKSWGFADTANWLLEGGLKYINFKKRQRDAQNAAQSGNEDIDDHEYFGDDEEYELGGDYE